MSIFGKLKKKAKHVTPKHSKRVKHTVKKSFYSTLKNRRRK